MAKVKIYSKIFGSFCCKRKVTKVILKIKIKTLIGQSLHVIASRNVFTKGVLICDKLFIRSAYETTKKKQLQLRVQLKKVSLYVISSLQLTPPHESLEYNPTSPLLILF